MKPTVIAANANSDATGPDQTGAGGAPNGMNIPINREYTNSGTGTSTYGSPKTHMRQQQPQQQIPAHFQQSGFGFEPDMDMDMDMFPRSRLGRAHHDPFAGFGGSHFGFPQFGSMGRRRAAGGNNDAMADDDDFFNRLPSEFRQYIPETFGQRRAAGNAHQAHHPQQPHPDQYYQGGYAPKGNTPPTQFYAQPNDARNVPQSPSKRLCDAAIQTDEVDHSSANHPGQGDNLNQHGLRNTVDMGVKSPYESDPGSRSHSAPPPEQQNIPANGKRPTPPPGVQQQFGTQTSPQMQSNFGGQYTQPPQAQAHRSYYAPQQQSHTQQNKQQTPPPPQTPGGSYIRTIPIFVEGRSEPVINSHKEIPNQNAAASGAGATANASASAQAFAPQHHSQQQQQHRPAPLNTQQNPQLQPQAGGGAHPPQTPHTLDSINKIQDIQRDVLDLMGKVEQFGGVRQDKEYVYLDEMLTRNLLKLDTIDTNGKESIRLARKEAIKCIQASINVLEAKAEENANNKSGEVSATSAATDVTRSNSTEQAAASTGAEVPAAAINQESTETSEAKNIQEAIPLPPPPSAEQSAESVAQAASADAAAPKAEGTEPQQDARDATPTNN